MILSRKAGQRNRLKHILLRAGALLGMAVPVCTHAAEGGLSNFPFGAQTSYAALMPPPGTTSFFGYTLFYSADSVRDNRGDRIPGVEVDVVAVAPRIVHTWNHKFAGFNLSSGAVIEGLYAKVQVPGAEEDNTGATLIGIEPLYLTKAVGTWHFLTGPLLYIPIGPHSANRLANTNLNYAALAYQGSATWIPTPDWDVSLNAAVEFKDRNDVTRYHSGTQSGLTFGVGHRPFADKRWDLGFSGFYVHQLSDDEVGDQDLPGGGRTRKLALGPKLVYWIAPGAGIVVQWHRETHVRNAPQGDLLWVECAFPL